MHAWLKALRRIESTVPCMPCRAIFPSSISAWKALESCSRCVPCTQLDMIPGSKVCPGYKRLCLVHCLCTYPCPKLPMVPSTVGGCGILTFLPKPASCRFAFSLPLLTYLPSFLCDRPSLTLVAVLPSIGCFCAIYLPLSRPDCCCLHFDRQSLVSEPCF
jgi:hypothetical protein